jgi:hypothetical protein
MKINELLSELPTHDLENNPVKDRILKLARDMAKSNNHSFVTANDLNDAVDWYRTHGYIN